MFRSTSFGPTSALGSSESETQCSIQQRPLLFHTNDVMTYGLTLTNFRHVLSAYGHATRAVTRGHSDVPRLRPFISKYGRRCPAQIYSRSAVTTTIESSQNRPPPLDHSSPPQSLFRNVTAPTNVKYNHRHRATLPDENNQKNEDTSHSSDDLHTLGSDVEIRRALYEMLRRSATAGNTAKVEEVVKELTGRMQEEPNLQIYSAMILVNSSTEHGSAAELQRILAEMAEEGILLDETAYHSVLKVCSMDIPLHARLTMPQVLAIHPDCLLRDRIIEEMRERWISITVQGRFDIIAGLVREGQFELALDRYQSDEEVMKLAPKWLKDLLIYSLCDLGELDQSLRLLKDRISAGEANISPSIWYYQFDHACSRLHVSKDHI